ncbi:ATP-dependent helicase smarcad1, partial [Cichlidogyrus casuarinus]
PNAPQVSITHPVLNPINSLKSDIESPPSEQTFDSPLTGGKFFRGKRITNAEVKKRDYVNKELHSATTQNAANFMAGMGVVSAAARNKSKKPRDPDANIQDVLDAEKLEELGLSMNFEERDELLNFFNTAEEQEFYQLPGCSYRNASTLIRLRPFKSICALINRLNSVRTLSVDYICGFKDVMDMRKEVSSLLDQCNLISERISRHMGLLFKVGLVQMPAEKDVADGISEIAKSNDELASHSSYLLVSRQPPLLNTNMELKPYQMLGLNWLNMLHHEGVNGILADEMGLGKTIQAIAFLAHLYELGHSGPHLVMVPSSLLDNWARELRHWCPKLKVLVYTGSAEARKAIRVKIYEQASTEDFHVLLTSYSVSTSTVEDRAMLKRLQFHYGVFDEAHLLKNMMSLRYRNLMTIQVKRRILLTGTPMQNNLVELMSLLSFVMPQIFYENNELLKQMFRAHTTSPPPESRMAQVEQERIKKATELLNPFCLRRLKSDVISQMPVKTEENVHVAMTKSQAAAHAKMIERFREMRNQSKIELAAANKKRKTTNGETGPLPLEKVMNQLMELRKISNHVALGTREHYTPDLLGQIAQTLHKDKSHAKANVEFILEDLKSLSDAEVHRVCLYYSCLAKFALSDQFIANGSGKIVWLEKNLPKLLNEGHRMLIFSQFVIMLNLLEDWAKAREFSYLRLDGNTPVPDRQNLIDKFNEDASIGIFFLSTRVGGLGINLTSADTVILHDISFNPYQEKQAEDRCHRMGQTKPVKVIRLVTEGTVEENIWRIAREKLSLEQSIGMPGLVARARNEKTGEEETEQEQEEEEVEEDSGSEAGTEIDVDPTSALIQEDDPNPVPSLRALNPKVSVGSKRARHSNANHVATRDTVGVEESVIQQLLTQILEN